MERKIKGRWEERERERGREGEREGRKTARNEKKYTIVGEGSR